MQNRYSMFSNLTFERFREFAKNPNLSRHEKVGFPDEYREGKEDAIFSDIISKISNIRSTNKKVMEIGPGCSNLPLKLASLCKKQNHFLYFIDSEEMLEYLPNDVGIQKIAGKFPEAIKSDLNNLSESIDVIIAYSVIQYVYESDNLWEFLDYCLMLLANGGELLIGDIPNYSMRKRFLKSKEGHEFYAKFCGKNDQPEVNFGNLEFLKIDDSVVLSIIMRARASGFHAWLVPQSDGLPMANRREDILIKKP